jgi:sec-independent protein translocase protein TatB
VFDIGTGELLTLAIVALLIFGPERLPEMAAKAGRLVRQLRSMADGARDELSEQLGPEFRDLKLSDLQPRTLVRKHLLDGLAGDLDPDGDLRRTANPRSLLRDIEAAGAERPTPHNGTPSAHANGVAEPAAPEGTAPAPVPYDTDAT